MAENIGPKIQLEGEAEFKRTISEINQSLKTMGTEMKAVTSAYDGNDKSASKLSAQNEVLNKQIDAQKNKLNELKAMLDKAKSAYGENDAETQKYQQAVNLATADLNKMELELKANKSELDNVGKAAEEGGNKFTGFGAALKASVAALGAVAVAAGVAAVQLGKEVVQAFGELEQNLGGSEAVFGKYAESIQKSGEEAYKNLGVSQSEYLATANKMGALFQGSGIEQQKSLDLTEKAMQRAADMASVMGIDMSVAMESVAGAAKGNFTMMDNLGVAMNATNIEAYALSKGLVAAGSGAGTAQVDTQKLADTQDKVKKATLDVQSALEKQRAAIEKYGSDSTQASQASIRLEKAQISLATANRKVEEAMAPAQKEVSGWWKNASQAEKAEVAMQMFFENTEQYAGNFARESTETVTGSLGLWSAALGSFTAGLGNADADMTNLTENLVDAFGSVVKNIVPIIKNLTKALPEALKALMPAMQELLPTLLSTATTLFRQVLDALVTILPQLIPVAVEALMTIVDAIIDNLPLIISGALMLVLALANGIVEALPELIPALVDTVITIVETLIDNIDMLVEASIAIMIALATGLINALPRLIEKAPEIIRKLVTAIVENAPKLFEAALSIIQMLVKGIADNLFSLALAAGDMVGTIIEGIFGLMDSVFDVGVNIVKGLVDGIFSMASWLGDQISDFFGGVIDGAKEMLGIHSPSRVFAEIGENMALGLGGGFSDEMKAVAKQINKSIPTGDFAFAGAGGRGGININQTNNFNGNYKTRDGASAVRDLNRQLGLLYSR